MSTFTSKLHSPLGYGSMALTWKSEVAPDERAFECLKLAIDGGSNMINAGEFYGKTNLQMLARFFAKYPDYAEKTVLSVKGGLHLDTLKPDSSPEYLRKSVEHILEELKGTKKLDLFECARVDKNYAIEDTMKVLKGFVDEGLFSYIGLSECKAETIRRAHMVHPVGAVEVEYSPWSLDVETNGVLEACKELNIPLIAYSPLGRGFLTGQIRSLNDIPQNDMRRHLDRFKPEVFHDNLKIVDELKALADKKGITPTQLSLAWLLSQGVHPIPGSTRPEGVKESLGALKVKLTEADISEMRKIIDNAVIKGGRYNPAMESHLWG